MNINLMYLFCLVVFVASVSGVMSIAYQTSDLKSQLSDIKREIGTLTQFKADVYVGMTQLINSQKVLINGGQVLSLGQLRIHHFAEPHSDKFYPDCLECQKEKKEIIDKDTITTKK